MKRIFVFCKPYLFMHKWKIIVYMLVSIIVSVISIASPYVMGSFIDHLVYAIDTSFIYRYFMIFAGLCLLGFYFGYINNQLYVRLQSRIGYSINKNMLQHVQRLPLSYIKKQDSVYLNNRINNDSNSVIIFCLSIIQNIPVNLVVIVLPLILILRFSVTLSLVFFPIVTIYFCSYLLFRKTLYKVRFEFTEVQSRFFSKLNDQLFFIKLIKLNGIFEAFTKKLDDAFSILFSKVIKYQKVNYCFSGLDKAVMLLAQLAIFLIGGNEVIKRNLTIGQFTIINSYFGMLLGSGRYFFNLGQSIQETLVSYNRLIEIKSMNQETNGTIATNGILEVELKSVHFAYDNKVIMDNVSYRFTKGNIYAIIGENGIGKTTLIDVLLGLYIDEFSGDILYDSIHAKNLDLYSFRRHKVGISEQEPSLMADTLRNNIVIDADSKIDEDGIIFLCDALNLTEFVASLPKGIDTVINEKAANLSGGEKQKISLIRAFLKDPDIIILDEPTSALDSQSRNKLASYLQNIKNNKIILVITHDKELTSHCDEIISMTQSEYVQPQVGL